MKVTRAIVLYDKKTKVYVKKYPINITIDDIKQVFIPYDWGDPCFYGCYDITIHNVVFFKKHTDILFEFNEYDYCLEAFG